MFLLPISFLWLIFCVVYLWWQFLVFQEKVLVVCWEPFTLSMIHLSMSKIRCNVLTRMVILYLKTRWVGLIHYKNTLMSRLTCPRVSWIVRLFFMRPSIISWFTYSRSTKMSIRTTYWIGFQCSNWGKLFCCLASVNSSPFSYTGISRARHFIPLM